MRTAGIALALLAGLSCDVHAQNFEDHQKHVAAAMAALKAENAKEGKDCAQAHNQREDTICTGEVAQAADKDLTVFLDNLKALLPEQDQARIQASQDAWSDYRKKACDAVYAFYEKGAIRYSAQSRCEIRLTRERMRDLDDLYEMPLHH